MKRTTSSRRTRVPAFGTRALALALLALLSTGVVACADNFAGFEDREVGSPDAPDAGSGDGGPFFEGSGICLYGATEGCLLGSDVGEDSGLSMSERIGESYAGAHVGLEACVLGEHFVWPQPDQLESGIFDASTRVLYVAPQSRILSDTTTATEGQLTLGDGSSPQRPTTFSELASTAFDTPTIVSLLPGEHVVSSALSFSGPVIFSSPCASSATVVLQGTGSLRFHDSELALLAGVEVRGHANAIAPMVSFDNVTTALISDAHIDGQHASAAAVEMRQTGFTVIGQSVIANAQIG